MQWRQGSHMSTCGFLLKPCGRVHCGCVRLVVIGLEYKRVACAGDQCQLIAALECDLQTCTRCQVLEKGKVIYVKTTEALPITFSFFSNVRPLSDSSRQLDTQCSDTLGGQDFAPA